MPTRHALLATLSVTSFAVAASAQGPTLTESQTTLRSCTYDTCALRLSTRVFRGVSVSRGLNGPREPLGFAGGSLVRAVSAVPAAEAEAETGHRRYRTGGIYTILGTVASTTLAILATRDANSRSLTRNLWVGSIVMGGVTFYGATQIARGDESFSRAIWLYNRELPR